MRWLRSYGSIAEVPVVAVPPDFTSQYCSGMLLDGTPCNTRAQKTLSVRTKVFPHCGLVLGRDENAAATFWRPARRSRPPHVC